MKKIKVGILGATGSVGQKFVQLLGNHPYFEIAALCASDRSVGHKYSEKVNWILNTPIEKRVANMIIRKCSPDLDCEIVFSGLDSSVAGEIESDFAANGYHVISNSKNHRWDDSVPLLIPEVNPEHLDLIKYQASPGKIVTNPNCSTIGLALALKPLVDHFGVEKVNVVTMQAISGAGYPGVASLKIIDNAIPYISGEEEKMESEPLKIFGSIDNKKIKLSNLTISAQCNRVAVIDGHLEAIQVSLTNKVKAAEIIKVWNEYSGLPQKLELPSAPIRPIHYFSEVDYPQPRLNRDLDKGMAVSIGRLRSCPVFDYKFSILSHNTVRGAAGGSILCAELMYREGLFNK